MTEKTLAEQYAEGLEAMAAMLRAQPDLAAHLLFTGIEDIRVPVAGAGDPVAAIAMFARAGVAHRATVEKDYASEWAGVNLRWGPVGLNVYARRGQVCERVVVGTETVTMTVPDPEKLAEVPQVEVTETVEKVEWQCKPLLASDAGAVS